MIGLLAEDHVVSELIGPFTVRAKTGAWKKQVQAPRRAANGRRRAAENSVKKERLGVSSPSAHRPGRCYWAVMRTSLSGHRGYTMGARFRQPRRVIYITRA